MTFWIGLGVLVVVGVPALVALMTYISVQQMSRPDLKLQAVGTPHQATQYEHWATNEGFEWVGGYLLRGTADIRIAAWRHTQYPAYFCVYVAQNQVHFDLVTIYDGDIGLTTGSTKDGLLIPPAPGSYIQCFGGLEPEALWNKHLVAEAFMLEKLQLDPKPIDMPFDEVVVYAIHRQMRHVRTISL